MVCTHEALELLPTKAERLRCSRCHLTIDARELGEECCPECFEEMGIKHFEFDVVEDPQATVVRYRCEGCGVIIESP